MKVLLIGSGGREHALAWKLAGSQHVTRLWCAPGNAGIGEERLLRTGERVECVPLGAEDLPAQLSFAVEHRPDLTVVGPDNPLALGIVDLFQEQGLRIWGPNRKAAQFESSKAFSQHFMERHGIPAPRAGVFTDPLAAREFAHALEGRCAVKADGLALGKGVFICGTAAEADAAIESVMVNRSVGAAGETLVIQELLEGTEVSLHALCDGRQAKLFPSSKDHKRALDGDAGPNTGGMGTFSPAPFLTDAEVEALGARVLGPWLEGCEAEGIEFKGLIYPGLMLTESGPRVLEFNARFGDPETQVYMARLESDLIELIEASLDGRLESVDLKWKPEAAVCVVMASRGYPGSYEKGKEISGLTEVARCENTKVFHAGTSIDNGRIVTNGGRVLGVTAWGTNLESARAAAYAAVEKIQFDGAQFRRDIAGNISAQTGSRAKL